MLYITIEDKEVEVFQELMEQYPLNIVVIRENGFDMVSNTQVVIDVAKIVEIAIPSIIAAIQLVVTYRLEKRKEELSKKELALEKREMELTQANANKDEFEISISSNGETTVLVRTKDLDHIIEAPEYLDIYINDVKKRIQESR